MYGNLCQRAFSPVERFAVCHIFEVVSTSARGVASDGNEPSNKSMQNDLLYHKKKVHAVQFESINLKSDNKVLKKHVDKLEEVGGCCH